MSRLKTCLFVLASFFSLALCRQGVAGDLTYEDDVRPILKAHCFHCHGEAGEKEGELDLRLRRLTVQGGASGPAIVPGDAASSLLLARVKAGEMPPSEDKQLSPQDIATIERWIAAGAITADTEPEDIGEGPIFTAAERKYWAFQPVTTPEVPLIEHAETNRVRTPIDAFVLAKHTGAAPGFAPDAEKALLLRRACFDLTGLPPTLEQLDEALQDDSPEWWEHALDRLLASPHYGERWGRHWLDVAGYADSEGYTDEDRVRGDAWRYRDYVIRAFNDDKPFDQFIQEQLAGDEMVPPVQGDLSADQIEKLCATGFLRMAPDGTASGGINQTEARNQVIADTLQIVGTSLLGLTIQCAQCHDHRYDPIPQADYYRLRAIFEPALDWKQWKNPAQRRVSLYTAADRQAAKALEEEAAQVDKERQAKVEEYITRTLEEELEFVPEELAEPLRTAYRTPAKDRSEEQKQLLKEYPSVGNISPGSLYLYDQRRGERARKLEAEYKTLSEQYVTQTQQSELAKVPEEERTAVAEASKLPEDKRSEAQQALLAKYPGVVATREMLADYNADFAAELQTLHERVQDLKTSKSVDDLKTFSDKAAAIRSKKPEEGFLRALQEVPGKIPTTLVFHRGDPEQPRDEVLPQDLSILSGRPDIPSNVEELPTSGRRLTFAQQLTDGTHPLLARVIVNRIWLQHFGKGLVNSPADFGFLGERPTHPRLLDWLATEFVSSGWSVKHLHRLIMTSTAYRQSSVVTAAASELDPENALYSRFPLRRLEAEVIRDAMIAVTGKLNAKMYGPPIPVMEDSVGQIVLGMENLDGERKPVDKVDLKGEEYRRSIYVQVRRTRTLSMFETFDAATMTPNCERRNSSTVAPQSLFFMNSAAVVDFADLFVERLQHDVAGGVESQVQLAWQLVYAVPPAENELQAAIQFINQEREHIKQQNDKLDPPQTEQLALSLFCQALLGSNRFLYVE